MTTRIMIVNKPQPKVEEPNPVRVTFFGDSREINLSALAKAQKIDSTEGWQLCVKQNNCQHQMTTLFIGMFSSADVCTICGYLLIDRGEPES